MPTGRTTRVSIRAPARGATIGAAHRVLEAGTNHRFNPRPRTGGDIATPVCLISTSIESFNPRPRTGGDTPSVQAVQQWTPSN